VSKTIYRIERDTATTFRVVVNLRPGVVGIVQAGLPREHADRLLDVLTQNEMARVEPRPLGQIAYRRGLPWRPA
jgi:hypothetical protein